MMDTDAVRKEFAEAYKAYVAEGYRMRELLLERRLNEDSDSRAIVEQQKRVNKAKDRYEAANRQYVFQVIGHFSRKPGQTV
jgi:hypothetical protein